MTNRFREKRLSILASCMTNLSEFNYVFSSRALIHLNKDAFEGHLCKTVNNFVKHIRNTRVSCMHTLKEPCSSTMHPLNLITVVLLVRVVVVRLSVWFISV